MDPRTDHDLTLFFESFEVYIIIMKLAIPDLTSLDCCPLRFCATGQLIDHVSSPNLNETYG